MSLLNLNITNQENNLLWRKDEVFFDEIRWEFLRILEIWEFDNDRVDKILEQYDFETLLRFPGVLIECFLYGNIDNSTLTKFNCRTYESPCLDEIKKEYRTNDHTHVSSLHLETGYNIILFYCDLPIANINLNLNLISQIQSATIYAVEKWEEYQVLFDGFDTYYNYSHNSFIQLFNWKKVLVKLAEKYVREQWIDDEIMLQSAWSNGWSKVNNQSSPNQWWYNIYDKTALELWYKFESLYWYQKWWYIKKL